MNIDFELYRIFYVVAQHKNITRAAEELLISQPAISKSIKNLEEQLGGQLFIRTKRGVNLTDEGKEFFNYIKQAIEYIDNAERKFSELKNLEAGCIKIGIGSTLTKDFLLPYLEAFHNQYPKIDIQIVTNSPNELMTKLKNGLIDLIILKIDDIDNEADIKLIKCQEVNDCFIANRNYQELIDKELSLKDLNNYPLILPSKGSNTRTFLDNIAKQYGVILKPNMELTSYSLVVEFTKIGLGIGCATVENIQDDLKNHKLYKLNIKENIPPRHICIALSLKHIPNFGTKKLVELITKNR